MNWEERQNFYQWREMLAENWTQSEGTPRYVIARMMLASAEDAKKVIEE